MQNSPVAKPCHLSRLDEDAALAVAAAERDPAAFGELYQRYVSRVYRYLYSHVNESADAEDLTAQVFTAAWESIHRYQEQGKFAAWLFRIVRNKLNDYHRRRRSQVPLDEDSQALLEDYDPLANLERTEALHHLGVLVNQLDPEHLELLRLRFAADLSYAEIAVLLGRSEAAVKMSLRRLLQRLQVAWEK